MLFRQAGERRRRALTSASSAATVFRASSIRAVSSTSWLVSEVCTARCTGAEPAGVQGLDLRPEVRQQRDHRVAAALGPAGNIGEVVAARVGRVGHHGGGAGRSKTGLLQHGGPAGLDGENRRQAPHGPRSAPPPGATPTRD